MKTPTTFLNRTLMTSRPSFRLCRSAVLISAAIAVTSANAVVIGRLPSTSVTGGQVIGAKPNVFIIIDNTLFDMAKNPKPVSRLQQTAAALITALPQLEGKVRLGYTTAYAGINLDNGNCSAEKLNGNVNKISQFIPKIKEDLEKNSNYLLADEDFVFGRYGSGYGEVTPRDFRDNYARFIYAWLGGMCGGSGSEEDRKLPYPNTANTAPPYADLKSGAEAYRKAAKDAGNEGSYSSVNTGAVFTSTNARPIIDAYARVIREVADATFLQQLAKCRTQNTLINAEGYSVCSAIGKGYFGHTSINIDPLRLSNYQGYDKEYNRLINDKLPEKIKNNSFINLDKFYYDAYANARSDNGFPGVEPLSCRKNYTIFVANGAYSSSQIMSNLFGSIGVPASGVPTRNKNYQSGIRFQNGFLNWDLPTSDLSGKSVGITDSVFPFNKKYVQQFLYKPASGSKSQGIAAEPNSTQSGQYPDRNSRFSQIAMMSYYNDLRKGLENKVPAYYEVTQNEKMVDGTIIPKEWNWKNDTANWQHMTIFNLGFLDSFSGWRKVANNSAKAGNALQDYFQSISDGTINSDNTPLYDFSRGQFGFENKPYIFRNKKINFSDLDYAQMDFAKAGYITRGNAFDVSDYESIKNIITAIADRIEKAMASGITGGSVGGGSRITGTIQQAGGSNSVLFTTYMDEETTSGNLFTFKNCPLIQKKIRNAAGKLEDNPLWARYKCGVRLWNAATVLDKAAKASNYLANKTIVPVKQTNGELQAQNFTWANLKGDAELKAALQDGDSEALGEARLEWINGRLQSTFSDDIKSKLRVRTSVSIPEENQRYSRDDNGKLVKDDNGTLIEAKTTRIPNRMGEIVYAAPQAVEPVGTLPAAHPLNDQSYTDFIKRSIIGSDRNNPARPAMVIVGANDGRLYGFTSPKPDAGYAELKFSFIPRTLLINGSVTATTSPNYNTQNARSLVNGPFTVRDAKVGAKNASAAWGTYVVGTLGAGGNAIYALDISSGQAKFKWEVRLSDLHSKADDKTPISGAGNMEGAIMAPPRIVWLRDTRKTAKPTGKWVVLVPSGYNSNEVSLLVLDLANGELLANIQTGARYSKVDAESNSSVLTCTLNELAEGSQGLTEIHKQLSSKITLPVDSTVGCDNGLGPLTAIDSNSDGGVDYVYAGDLLGHIWKFDLTEFFQSGKGKVAYNSPLFVAQTHGNKPTRQPITSMIEVADSQNGEGNMLYFGTGRLFNQEERGLNQQETFYAVWDNPRYFEDGIVSLPMNRASKTGYQYAQYVSIPLPFKSSKLNDGDAEDSILRDNKRFGDLRGIKRYQDSTTSTAYLACNLEKRCSANGIMGWAMDFPPANGEGNPALERVIDRGQVFENAIYFSSFTPTQGKDGESCDTKQKTAGGEGRFYSLNRFTGNYLAKSPFDLNNDNKRDEKDSIKVSSGEMGSGQGDDYATDENGNYLVGLAGVSLGSTNGSFVSLQGVPGINPPVPECDFTRQIIFPASVDTETGDPLTLTGCYQNRFNVWKQPVDE